MMNTISTSIKLIDDKVKFAATAAEYTPITVDYPPPFGTDSGYNALQLFLISLSSCAAMSLVTLMRDRMRTTIAGLEVSASGVTRDEHPKTFTHIQMRMVIHSPDATKEKVERALRSVEEKLCPVWALVKGNVEVETSFEIAQ